jgi:hypothetical protein
VEGRDGRVIPVVAVWSHVNALDTAGNVAGEVTLSVTDSAGVIWPASSSMADALAGAAALTASTLKPRTVAGQVTCRFR